MLRKTCVAFALGLVLAASPVLAKTKILSAAADRTNEGSKITVVLGVPKALTRDGVTTIGDGRLANDTLYAFPEQQGVTLANGLSLSGSRPIAAGTKVDSFYVCLDTSENARGAGPRGGLGYEAVLRFDNGALLGTALRPSGLAETAQVLGNPDLSYANSRFLGVDPYWMGQDSQSFAAGNFVFRGNANGIDCIRLIFRAK